MDKQALKAMTGEISKEKVLRVNKMLKNSVIEIAQKPEGDHDFSWVDEPTQKQETVMSEHLKRRINPYTSSRIETRNFLSNIFCTGVTSEDFVDKNINPFSLERKITEGKNRDIIYMLWDERIKKSFCKQICENQNFIYLNSKNVLYGKTAHIVLDCFNKDSKNMQNHMNTIQFVYSKCFPEVYSFIDKRGIVLRVIVFKRDLFLSWKDKKVFSQIISEKNPYNKQNLEQNIEDEKVIKKLNEKKLKRKVLAEKYKGFERGCRKASKS